MEKTENLASTLHSEPFYKCDFFKLNPQFRMTERFEKAILKKAGRIIPGFNGNVSAFRVKYMTYGFEIGSSLGNFKPFSPDEICALFKILLELQSGGERGTLSLERRNLFFAYVQVEFGGTEVIATIDRERAARIKYWILDTVKLDDRQEEGCLAFYKTALV
jgi:hypothetical protein